MQSNVKYDQQTNGLVNSCHKLENSAQETHCAIEGTVWRSGRHIQVGLNIFKKSGTALRMPVDLESLELHVTKKT